MNRPILLGAICGVVGLVILLIVHTLVLSVHYFFYYEGGSEYVEDGAFMEFVIMPIVVTLIFGPVMAGAVQLIAK
jgi:hypothetical protein